MFYSNKTLYLAERIDLPSSATKPLINPPRSEYVSLRDMHSRYTSTSWVSASHKIAVRERRFKSMRGPI